MWTRCLLFFAILCGAVNFSLASDAPAPETISLSERVVIASHLYSAIQMYFGHWKGLPDFDLDKDYAHYIQQVIASDDRHQFDLASIEFLASLKNSHSGFSDKWLRENFGHRLGFYAYPIDGEWVITRSSIKDLNVGETITAIDGEPFEAFYQRNRKYVSASDERWRRRAFFENAYLFPASFTLTLQVGRRVSVTRRGEFRWPGDEFHSIESSLHDDVAILRIPSFAPQNFEDSAVEFLKKLGPVKALILDLRGNHGGSTPSALVAALMDRPYRWMAESTPATLAVFRAWDMLSSHTELAWGSDPQQPSQPLYSGPLYMSTKRAR
jgi:carboxyl-terminal processing protease